MKNLITSISAAFLLMAISAPAMAQMVPPPCPAGETSVGGGWDSNGGVEYCMTVGVVPGQCEGYTQYVFDANGQIIPSQSFSVERLLPGLDVIVDSNVTDLSAAFSADPLDPRYVHDVGYGSTLADYQNVGFSVGGCSGGGRGGVVTKTLSNPKSGRAG